MSGAADDVAQPTPQQLEFFEAKVRPLLSEHCVECHSDRAKKLQAGLHLDSRAGLLKGGEGGPAIVPGKADASGLVQAVRYESVEMPPSGKLKDDQIATLVRWVEMGAPWPPQSETRPAESDGGYDWDKLRNEHWAWQPLQNAEMPSVGDTQWPQNGIDYFVLARLEASGMKPAPRADRRTLIRRTYFDLIGLPPTPDDVEAFVNDARPDAYARVVDQLLASPQYGERWGRHWLDVARYSDGLGGFADKDPLPEAWRYRDWVVRSWNADLPYDRFVRQQIAGDLMKEPDSIYGPGFFAIGPIYKSDGGDPDSVAQAQSETLDDRVDTFSRGFLALTVACARCHDHKFDPIPTLDYYSLAGVFNNSKKVDKPGHTLAEAGSGDMKVALRGNLRKPGPVAPRRFLRVLAGADPPPFTQGSGRLELADAVADPKNPLTARVMVNRIWQHHFGRAIVRSPSNFGALGQPPTHPLLLDWLAARFIESGWSAKELHRTIVLSSAYQMSSEFDGRNYAADGDNRLLWRMNPQRLEVEAWRDGLLAATGELDASIGGAPTDKLLQSRRRTLYSIISRNGDRFESDEFLRLFDFPAPRVTSEGRTTSIVPQQFLFLMNSPFMTQRAKAFAARLASGADDDAQRIHLAYELLFARPPNDAEFRIGLDFLANSGETGQNVALTPWEQYAQVLLSANEFMYVR